MLRLLFDKFFADFLRVYRVLSPGMRGAVRGIFACVVMLSLLEVGTVLSITFLSVSIAAPEKLRDFGVVARLFGFFPQLDALCEEPRFFALLTSCGVVILIIAKNFMSGLVNLKTARLGERIALFAGEAIFKHYLYSPYIAHLAGNSQGMFQALSWRGQLGFMAINFMTVYTYAAVTLFMLATLLSATPGVVLLIIPVVAATAIGVYKNLKSKIDRAGKNAAEYDRAEARATMNAMSGIREVLIYRQQKVFFDSFRSSCLGGINDKAFLVVAPSIPTWTLESVGFLVIPVTLWVMYAVQDASMARITGVLTIIMLISWRVLPLLNRSLSALVSVRGIRHAALDCLTYLEEALASPVRMLPEPDPNFSMRRGIAFEHVAFRYPKAREDCLHDLSFTIPCGSKVAFIGQSGAGKSSIASILSGLVLPTGGRVLVDGKTLGPAEQAAYCRRIGYVPQAPYILGGSLAENTAFSQWGRPWDEEKVIRACAMAGLDMIERCGVNYQVGAGGASLSGGQGQRLSIARALYADPAVLILDEATSALDSGVEAAIMNTIFNLPQNMTIILIAHRLTTVSRCDTLFWIDGGCIKDCGSPRDILPRYEQFLSAAAGVKAP